MTDYTNNKKLKFVITKDQSGTLGGPGLYEYDFAGDYFTYLEYDIFCAKCGTKIGCGIEHGISKMEYIGPEILEDTVCEECGESLYDEKADVKEKDK